MKRINPFYLNRQPGGTRPLNVFGGILRWIIVQSKLNLTRSHNGKWMTIFLRLVVFSSPADLTHMPVQQGYLHAPISNEN
ncbi:MAG: hypothetical protein R3B95_16250 [Nitrospirales bacterium]|nr:hypothetical protein [Nitrospirales bacterium]